MKGQKDVGFGSYCMRFREEKYILSKNKKKDEHKDLELGKKLKKKRIKKKCLTVSFPSLKLSLKMGFCCLLF